MQNLSLISDEIQRSALDFSDVPVTPFPIDYFGRKKGVRSSQIHQSIISEDGRVWSASPVGLLCYDGVSIRLFGLKNGLNCHGLRALVLGANQTLWLGSDAGVEILDISGTAPISKRFFRIGIVDSIAVFKDGGIIGTPNGIYRIIDDVTIEQDQTPFFRNTRITSTLVDEAGDIWVAGSKFGVARLKQNNWDVINVKAIQKIGNPIYLARGPHNNILVGCDYGVAVLTAAGEISYTLETRKPVTAIHWCDELIWLGVGDDLVTIQIAGNALQFKERVLKDTLVRNVISDEYKNIWVSTDNIGIVRVSGMRHFLKSHHTENLGAVFCIRQCRSGKLIGGANGLLLPNQRTVLKGKTIWDAFEDARGTIWAATQQGFFQIPSSRLDQGTALAADYQIEALAAPCRAIELCHGYLYVGTTKGLVKFGPDGPQEIFRPSGKSLGYVYSLHTGPDGNLWVATLGAGLWHLEKNHLIKSVLGGSINRKSNVYALAHTSSGSLYFCHDGYISRIGDDGLPTLFINTRESVSGWSLKILNDDKLALGTSDGFVIYDCQTRERLKRVSINSDTSNWEFTCSRSLHIDNQGNAFCGVSTGLKTINVNKLMNFNKRPVAELARIKWHQVEPRKKENLYVVGTGKWRFDVEIRNCWYLNEDNCKMRYRLIGFDKEWSTLKPIGPISYTSLPRGGYRLEVCLYSSVAGLGEPRALVDILVRD
ncbi:MAG: hypothetical protein HKO02_03345 [Hyphomonadaceae bacterium]|nr:hypothetical protein [Hyphomonadaceae bacterium]